MNVVAEKNDCNSEFIQELLATNLPRQQIEHALETLQSSDYVNRSVRNVCIGAYILLKKDHDPQIQKLKEPITFKNKCLSKEEREQLIAVLNLVNIDNLSERFENTSLSNTCTTEAEAAASSTKKIPPRLYDSRGHLNQPYEDMLKHLGIDTWMIDHSNEKPIEIWSTLPEVEFKKKLSELNGVLAERLFLFNRYRYLKKQLINTDDSLISGSRFQEEDFNFSRTQVKMPFCNWPATNGTVGLLLKMDHPTLGKKIYGLTCAHVVFSKLSRASKEDIDMFNENIDFAHYDLEAPTAPCTNNLDFCLLDVRMSNADKIQNLSNIKLKSLEIEPIASKDEIIKIGSTTGLTSSLFYSSSGLLVERKFIVVTSYSESPFACPGDSGSLYLWKDANTHLFYAIALHCTSSHDEDGKYIHGGCSIVQCLQKFIQKRTKMIKPPKVSDIQKWFVPFCPEL